MIKNIYILSRNGILLYSKNFIEQKFDDNLIIGFFTSIENFSREALESIVKYVDLGVDNKLILQPKPDEKIFGAAIVSSKDNNILVNKILDNILQDFIDDFSPNYDLDRKSKSKIDKNMPMVSIEGNLIEIKKSKSGTFFLKIEDSSGTIDIVVFKNSIKNVEEIKEGDKLLVQGKPEIYKGSPEIIATKITKNLS